jgi:hypothetical protein
MRVQGCLDYTDRDLSSLVKPSPCVHDLTAERLLHEMLASVDRNVLRLILVGLRKEKKLPVHLQLRSSILIPSSILFL